MPRKSKATRSRKTHAQGEYTSPFESVQTVGSALETAIIPPFKAQLPRRESFRFVLTSGVGITTAFTTTMMLDMFCITTGGSASPVRLFNNMKLVGVKLWQPFLGAENQPFDTLSIEFSPSLTAGFGGTPRVPYTSPGSSSTAKYAHLSVKPKKTELASQWFSAQQAAYTLFNIKAGIYTIMQIDFVVTNVNGETPVTCAYTSSITKGTVGVTNFGVTGCRSIGLENLVNP